MNASKKYISLAIQRGKEHLWNEQEKNVVWTYGGIAAKDWYMCRIINLFVSFYGAVTDSQVIASILIDAKPWDVNTTNITMDLRSQGLSRFFYWGKLLIRNGGMRVNDSSDEM